MSMVEIRSLVYKYGMQNSNNPDSWEIMFSRYVNEINSQEKSKLLYGLSQVKEPWILERFLGLAKNESNVRSQDYFTVLSYISYNPTGNPLVWNFIRSEWPYLLDRKRCSPSWKKMERLKNLRKNWREDSYHVLSVYFCGQQQPK